MMCKIKKLFLFVPVDVTVLGLVGGALRVTSSKTLASCQLLCTELAAASVLLERHSHLQKHSNRLISCA